MGETADSTDYVNLRRPSNTYQEPMASGADHPLKWVDPELLACARRAMRNAESDLLDPAMVEPIADMIVMALRAAGHIGGSGEQAADPDVALLAAEIIHLFRSCKMTPARAGSAGQFGLFTCQLIDAGWTPPAAGNQPSVNMADRPST